MEGWRDGGREGGSKKEEKDVIKNKTYADTYPFTLPPSFPPSLPPLQNADLESLWKEGVEGKDLDMDSFWDHVQSVAGEYDARAKGKEGARERGREIGRKCQAREAK